MDEWDGTERRRTDDLRDLLTATNEQLADLSERVTLAADLNDRQVRVAQSLRWQRALVAVVVLALGSFVWQANRIQCQALNDTRSENAGLWIDLLDKFPAAPLPDDATPEQVVAHDEEVARAEQVRLVVTESGHPRNC